MDCPTSQSDFVVVFSLKLKTNLSETIQKRYPWDQKKTVSVVHKAQVVLWGTVPFLTKLGVSPTPLKRTRWCDLPFGCDIYIGQGASSIICQDPAEKIAPLPGHRDSPGLHQWQRPKTLRRVPSCSMIDTNKLALFYIFYVRNGQKVVYGICDTQRS